MTKKSHPAAKARTLTGVVSAVAVVGIVTAFQLSAQAQPQIDGQSPAPNQANATPKPTTKATTAPVDSVVTDVAVVDPGVVTDPGVVVDPATVVNPAPAVDPVVVPAPAPPAPAPVTPVTPPNGSTGGSGA